MKNSIEQFNTSWQPSSSKDHPLHWERSETELMLESPVFKINTDTLKHPDNKKTAKYHVIDSPDWVNVFALTEDRKLVVIEQFRFGSRQTTLEPPGGMVDEGESPADAGRRELLEETGFACKEMIYLGYLSPNPAILNNTVHYFFAKDAFHKQEQNLDPGEAIQPGLISLFHFDRLVKAGRIKHSLAVSGFQLLQKYLEGSLELP